MTDSKLSEYDVKVLRVINGEDIPGIIAGAALWATAAWLKGRGYAQGHYEIAQKGRDYLAALESAS